MNEQVNGDWFLVARDGAGELRVVSRNAEPVEWRRLTNVLRGWKLKAAQNLIAICDETGAPAAGQGYAAPVMDPSDKTAHAFLVSLESANPAGVPAVGTWTWDFSDTAVPPVLHFSADALELLGVSLDHRDRTLYGPADFFTRSIRFADILTHTSFLYDAEPNSTRNARTAFRADNGELRDLYMSEVVDVTGDAQVIRGLAWAVEDADPRQRSIGIADTELAILLANNSDQLVLIGDIRFTTAPYVLKWVTPHPPGIGHGASTGQAPGLHPDDLGKLVEYVMLLGTLAADDPVPEISGIRVRRAGGGWMIGRGRGFRPDHEHFPTIWVALVSMSD
ncbi:hypothetical protein [Williamsia herbipolensis]|uniref:hypothetical protein n=1 Tax=Williamsia herbipolensis TaxID=1603258 RepID=UPI0005F82FBF|nr:hypothetical protein [Williamsia herbipolensis]